jgi:hypothetical protein
MNLTLNNSGYYSGTDAARQGLAQVGVTAGTTFFLASNFNPGTTTPATNFRSYSSTLSAAGTNDNASFATTTAAPFTSPSDLHIPIGTVTPLDGGGATVGVAFDIDGEPRNCGTPDIGADEFGTPPPLNDIAATALLVPAPSSIVPTGSGVTPQASFTNVGSANQVNVMVRFTITGPGGFNYTDTQTIATIAACQIVPQTFAATGTFTTPGTYNMTATNLFSDTNAANDAVSGSFEVRAPLSGTVTVGTGGDFPSLTNPGGVFEAINGSGVSGNLTVNIISDLSGETGTVPLNEFASPFTVTIRPNGAARLVTGSSTVGIIRLNAADRVLIEGSLTGGTATQVGGDASLRNLTIVNSNTAATAGAVVIFGSNGANGAQNGHDPERQPCEGPIRRRP